MHWKHTADVDRLAHDVHAVLGLVVEDALEAALALGEAMLGVALRLMDTVAKRARATRRLPRDREDAIDATASRSSSFLRRATDRDGLGRQVFEVLLGRRLVGHHLR